MSEKRPIREARRFAPPVIIMVAVVLSTASSTGLEAQPCLCPRTEPFGGCAITDLGQITQDTEFPGDFPGSAFVVPALGGAPHRLFIVDLFGGQTYRVNPDPLALATEGIVEFPSPRASLATAGVALVPREGRLYWSIGNRIVVTEVPGEDDRAFDDVRVDLPGGSGSVALELEVDLADLARRLFGDASRAGRLGGLTYHAGRGTLWAVDIVNDVYFELALDGSLSLSGGGRPIHFFSPALAETSSEAFGNSLAYVKTPDGEFFDLTAGTLAEGRVSRVVRVLAPTAPSASEPFGQEVGVGYELYPDLIKETTAGATFVTGLAYLENSCGVGQNSEFVVVFDKTGNGHTVLEISADRPQVTAVADLACDTSGGNTVRLTWRSTGRYNDLKIVRESLTDSAAPSVQILATSEDPGEFTDVTLPLPADGTYRYRVLTSDTTIGPFTREATCTATVGRGSLLDSVPVQFAVEAGDLSPAPFAVAKTSRHLLVVDSASGTARRWVLGSMEPAGTIQGPFRSRGEHTRGLAWTRDENRLYWLGQIGSQNVIQSTAPDGSEPGTLRTVQYPLDLIRNPVFGDLSFDAGGDRLWLADVLHNVIFAISRDGTLIPDSVIDNPEAGAQLGGGIDTAASNGGTFSLDIVSRDADDPTSARLHRVKYPRAALDAPEIRYTLALGAVTSSAAIAGVEVRKPASGEVQFVVGTDTSRLYTLDLEPAPLGELPFRRGDANNDGKANISDASFVLSWLFKSGDAPPCEQTADVDDSGTVNISDPLMLFNYLFRQGTTPPAPFGSCGFDITASDLGCEDSICLEDLAL